MPTQQITKYEDLRKEVAQRYEQLHPDLKAALVSVDTAGAVYEIAKKFGLNIEKTGYLADIIGYTVIGIFPVADFMRNLKEMLGVDSTKAEEIAREVNNKIFLAIRDQLKKTHGEKWDERAITAAKQEAGITKSVLRDETTKPPMSTTPKNPWEIKPDGLQKMVAEVKSVIPPTPVSGIKEPALRAETVKAAEAEVKKAALVPPEMSKTREAPQPAPMAKGVAVLKEIKPLQPTTRNIQPTITPTKPITYNRQPATPTKLETVSPAGLPIMKEARKLIQTPELSKPTINNQQSVAPPTKPTIDNLQPTTPATPTQKYNADPYREPIE